MYSVCGSCAFEVAMKIKSSFGLFNLSFANNFKSEKRIINEHMA
jgi:hypothetical protein